MWTRVLWRVAAADAARDTASDLIELCCDAPSAIAIERLRTRAATGMTWGSDADERVAAFLATTADPWPTAVTVDTVAPLERSLRRALDACGASPS